MVRPKSYLLFFGVAWLLQVGSVMILLTSAMWCYVTSLQARTAQWEGLHTCYKGNYQLINRYLSSDSGLELAQMKLELLVIAVYHPAVNLSLETVQTACQYCQGELVITFYDGLVHVSFCFIPHHHVWSPHLGCISHNKVIVRELAVQSDPSFHSLFI
jgi:hypothetical protein